MKLVTINASTKEVRRDDDTLLGAFSSPLDWNDALSKYIFTESDGSQWCWNHQSLSFTPVVDTPTEA